MVADPQTGEVIDDNLAALEQAEAEVDDRLRALSPVYEYRRQLRERIAELRGAAELPRPRFRTNVQQKVSECPRCGYQAPRK